MHAASEAFSFDPGQSVRQPGPWTRLRRSLTSSRVAVAGAGHFNPDLDVQLAGTLTRARRSGDEAVEQFSDAAAKAVPVAFSVLVVTSLLAKAQPLSGADSPPRDAPRSEALLPGLLEPAKVRATLVGNQALVPDQAPQTLKDVVAAANRIQGFPYLYGGGHGSFAASGYDCSGAVSYALHGGGLLASPLASGAFASWGEPGPGKAITIYAHGGHAFAVIAGLRWDTSGTGSSGPSWHTDMRSTAGFVARHPAGY